MLSFQRRFSQVVNHSKILQHEVLMKLALRHAQAAYREKEIPIGAIVVNEKGIVLSTGRSRMESQRDSNAQAEVISISLAQSILKSNSLKNCSLYTTLEPCGNIMTLIKESNLRSVYYGAQDNENGAIHGRSHLDKELLETGLSQIEFVDGLLETDSTNLLDSFFRARKREAPDQILLSYRGFRPKSSPGS